MTKVYRVYDDEWEQPMGEIQIREFAISQVYNSPDDFLPENINFLNTDEKETLVNLANKILNSPNLIPNTLTMKEVKLILTERCFDIEELNIY